MTPREAADYLGVSVGRLRRWRWQRQGPGFARFGVGGLWLVRLKVRYRRQSLDRYRAQNRAWFARQSLE